MSLTLRLIAALVTLSVIALAGPDGKVFRPIDYNGSLEERAQEAILIFHKGTEKKSAVEEMILKIQVEGEVDAFAWVVPMPKPPEVFREDPKIFAELHDYVSHRLATQSKARARGPGAKALGSEQDGKVEVISRKIVGSYDVAIVRENAAGALNGWLEENGYQPVKDADDVLSFYRRKGYVYACLKVSQTALSQEKHVELHPLRFRFETGGRDGIYFPMRLTGLQEARFDVNLHVFYEKWINDRLSPYGYQHRGFRRQWRDFDSQECEPNAGKAWSAPTSDPYLKPLSHRLPTVTRLFQKIAPGDRFYLTNISAQRLDPHDVRDWPDDLWLFPYYTDPDFVPFDARPGGVAADAYARLR